MQAWCLVVSSMGDFVVTSGADRALRVWQRTEEPFFVEEEKEKRLESLFEADLEVGIPSVLKKKPDPWILHGLSQCVQRGKARLPTPSTLRQIWGWPLVDCTVPPFCTLYRE